MTAVSAGTRLGPYEVVSRLGAGGMGEVWKARDTRLDRSVAIKVLPAELAHNSQFKLRFEREAKTISQLNHPHICTLYDVGDDYLVMELLEGETLADRLERGPLPLADVLKYGAQIAEALDRAHRGGVVHRDLKPGNVMITRVRREAPRLRPGEGVGDRARRGPDRCEKPLTQEGTILGTFQYMAPEQLEAAEADARTDIFALGAVLYEMSTGQRAFVASSKASLIAAIVKEQPRPISELQPLTPPAFEHVVTKCLEKDPEDRWQSARDVAQELRWIGEGGSQLGVPAPVVATRRATPRLAWSIAAIAAVVAVVAGWMAWRMARHHRGAAGDAILRAEHDHQPSRRNVRHDRHLAGRTGDRLLRHHRHVEDVVPQTDRPVRADPDRWHPRAGCSRSSRRTGSGWASSRASGSGRSRCRADGRPRSHARRARAARSGSTTERSCSVRTTTEASSAFLRRAARRPSSRRSIARRVSAAIAGRTALPGGKTILYSVGLGGSWDNARVVAHRLDTGERKVVLNGGTDARYVPTGHLVYVRGTSLYAVPFDVGRARSPRSAVGSHLRGGQPQRGRRRVRLLAQRHAGVLLAGRRWRRGRAAGHAEPARRA